MQIDAKAGSFRCDLITRKMEVTLANKSKKTSLLEHHEYAVKISKYETCAFHTNSADMFIYTLQTVSYIHIYLRYFTLKRCVKN